MNLICPFAIQRPGPAWKVYPNVNTFHGAILHSAEGYEDALWTQLEGEDVSWHFTVLRDGRTFQHYALDRSCWHAGSKAANLRLVGIEHEGVAGEPLTPEQLAASIRLVRWIAQQGSWDGLQRDGNLFEHREFFNTACPSGRIPWEFYTEEEDVQLRDLNQREEQILGAALPLHAGNWLAGANANLGAQMVVGSSPRQVLLTIADEDWDKAERA